MGELKVQDIETETVFPISLIDEVFDILLDRNIKILKYNDLDTKKSFCGSKYYYVDEYARFRTGGVNPLLIIRAVVSYYLLKRHKETYIWIRRHLGRKSFPATVILQHDADVMPERTVDMMKREYAKGITSSCFIFAKHAENVAYNLPINELKILEQYGFEIGYHLNAFERADYNVNNAFDLVREDLNYLNKFFNITSYVPHGGIASKDGRNNYSLPHEKDLKPLALAYNGRCVLKEFTWSDGGLRKNTPSDPRVFAKNIPNNSRAMMLIHPQYYGDTLRYDWETLPISKEKWWRDLWDL